ncbi:MAG: (Fe-S)-binding protein [Candidatus Methanofastidiosia archaeon]
MSDDITREIFWNIKKLIEYGHYIGFIIITLLILYALYHRSKMWRKGRGEMRFDIPQRRFIDLILYGFIQKKLFRNKYAGIMHMLMFSGFVMLMVGTAIVTLEADTPLHFFYGKFYIFFSFLMDSFGVILGLGVLMALYRRYIKKPEKLDNRWDDAVILVLLLVIVFSGFFIEALRIKTTKPDFEKWSFVGWYLSGFLKGLSENSTKQLHVFSWVFHSSLSLLLLLLITSTKFLHVLTSPLNIFFRSYQPKGALPSIPDFEEREYMGVSKMEDFTWKQMLDFDACTRCGRCQDACPAYASGMPLSPKEIIQELKVCMEKNFLKGKETSIYDIVTSNEIWSCTTCRACVEECPVFVEHINTIVDMRRYMVEQGILDTRLQDVLMYLTRYGNSFGQSDRMRARWTSDLEFKIKDARKEETEYLWFVGDYASYDPAVREITQKTARVLHKAGIDFGILYESERNAGNDVRRIGEEGLFEMLVEKNLRILSKAKFSKILTTDPHTYNTLKNEYPNYNGNYPVLHVVELLDSLIREGKLPIKKKISCRVTYHDPCYLGRYNNIYDAPRRVLEALGASIVEMPRSRQNSFCCGAGGGRIWMEDVPGIKERPAENRIREAVKLQGVEYFVVACPKEVSMFRDAVKTTGNEGKIVVKDIIELVKESLELKKEEEKENV